MSFGIPSGTICSIARARADFPEQRIAYRFVQERLDDAGELTYSELAKDMAVIAGSLRNRYRDQSRILLCLPTGLDFIRSFYGCLDAGMVAIPVPVPRRRALPRLLGILRDANPHAIVVADPLLQSLVLDDGEHGFLETLTVQDLLKGKPTERSFSEIDKIALLQYTSGSTGTPKGVVVSHGNIIENQKMIHGSFEHDAASRVASWLPPFHDMGLIGTILHTLYIGAESILMPPVQFFENPLKWFQVISHFKVHTSGGPNSAYDHCVAQINLDDCDHIDLSSWKIAFNGSEPIRPKSLDAFARKFSALGFDYKSFFSCYGLAEATLFVTGGSVARPPHRINVTASELASGKVGPRANSTDDILEMVSCGTPPVACDVRVVDPVTNEPFNEGVVGEISVFGPHVSAGYWHEVGKTWGQVSRRKKRYIKTGDLGFILNGELFITGRSKEMMIIRGQNYYPNDIEAVTRESNAMLLTSQMACFSMDSGREETICILIENSARSGASLADDRVQFLDKLAASVREAVLAEMNVLVAEVVFVRRGTIPLTSSGKVQRNQAREKYIAGDLTAVHRSFYDAGSHQTYEKISDFRSIDIYQDCSVEFLKSLIEEATAHLRSNGRAVGDETTLADLGLDSLSLLRLKHQIEGMYRVSISFALLSTMSVVQLAGELQEQQRLRSNHDTDTDRRIWSTDAVSDRAIEEKSQPSLCTLNEESLWLMEQSLVDDGALNLSVAIECTENEAKLLQQAIQYVVYAHPSLRATYKFTHGELNKIFLQDPQFSIEVVGDPHKTTSECVSAFVHRRFDLENETPIRCGLFERDEEGFLCVIVVHHIAADLWSFEIFANDLAQAFQKAKNGHIQQGQARSQGIVREEWFRHYSREQRTRWETNADRQSLDYWIYRFSPQVPALRFPFDKVGSRDETQAGTAEFSIGKVLLDRLSSHARGGGATSFAIFLAAFQILIGRWTEQQGFAIGFPTTGRDHAEMADKIGYFVNPVACRVELDSKKPFAAFLATVADTLRQDLAHSSISFSEITRALTEAGVELDARRPLFDVVFSWLQASQEQTPLAPLFVPGGAISARVGDLTFHRLEESYSRTLYDLEFVIAQGKEEAICSIKYRKSIISQETADLLAKYFQSILLVIAENFNTTLAEIQILTGEKASSLHDTSLLNERAELCGTIPELFLDMVKQNGKCLALCTEDGQCITYECLDRLVSSFSVQLSEAGIRAKETIAVLCEAGWQRIVSYLAINRVGAVFVALDPFAPRDAIGRVLNHARPCALVRSSSQRGADLCRHFPMLHSTTIIEFEDWLLQDHDWSAEVEQPSELDLSKPTSDDIAYIAYTSGSTGRPKAVPQTHRDFCSFIGWQSREFCICPGMRVGQIAAPSFDVSYCEIFGALCFGATLVLYDRSKGVAADEFLAWIEEKDVHIIQVIPSMFSRLLTEERVAYSFSHLRVILSVGETLHPALVLDFLHRFPEGPALYNVYGPTETVAATWYAVDKLDSNARIVPVGRPIDGRNVFILDQNGDPCPLGIRGEIVISGAISQGYLNSNPRLNTSFREFRSLSGVIKRGYWTGDYGRWRPDGNLEVLGRLDNQVKIAGVRIECEEIESIIKLNAGVRDCAVYPIQTNEGVARLVAVVEVSAPVEVSELRRLLMSFYSAAVVPAIRFVDSLPRNASGKIDRPAALQLAELAIVQGRNDLARDELESEICLILGDILGIRIDDRQSNFFQIGGNSLDAVKFLNRIRQRFSVQISLAEFVSGATVAFVAECLRERKLQSEENIRKSQTLLQKVKNMSDREVSTMLHKLRMRKEL